MSFDELKKYGSMDKAFEAGKARAKEKKEVVLNKAMKKSDDSEAEYRFLVQCKRLKCLWNKRMYVPITDTMQNCCGRVSDIIRLDENGECSYHPDKNIKWIDEDEKQLLT